MFTGGSHGSRRKWSMIMLDAMVCIMPSVYALNFGLLSDHISDLLITIMLLNKVSHERPFPSHSPSYELSKMHDQPLKRKHDYWCHQSCSCNCSASSDTREFHRHPHTKENSINSSPSRYYCHHHQSPTKLSITKSHVATQASPIKFPLPCQNDLYSDMYRQQSI